MPRRSWWCRVAVALAMVPLVACGRVAESPGGATSITIAYPTRSGASWPLYIAKEGGYYEKHGLDVTLRFGVHPASMALVVSGGAVMSNEAFDPAMAAATRDGSLVAVGSSLNRGLMSLMVRPDISLPQDLAGRRIGIGRVGDSPYHYTVALLGQFGLSPRDVQWIPSGADAAGRAATLRSGAVDAVLVTTPASFRLEDAGFRNLATLADYEDIFVSTLYLFRKSVVAEQRQMALAVIKAQAEAIKRFYDDKAFAVEAYLAYDRQQEAVDVGRVYDLYVQAEVLERIPYVLDGAVRSAVDRAEGPNADIMRDFDYRRIVDNSLVQELVEDGFFERLYGPDLETEQARRAALAFGL